MFLLNLPFAEIDFPESLSRPVSNRQSFLILFLNHRPLILNLFVNRDKYVVVGNADDDSNIGCNLKVTSKDAEDKIKKIGTCL